MDGSTGPLKRTRPDRCPRLEAAAVHPGWYPIPSFAIVAASLAALYWGYHQAAIPPGGDSGHWITVSRAFVGMSQPPGDFTLQPFLYPPLVFPFLGVTLLATGSPITTGFLFGGLLLAAYGLSVIHLSRRFLRFGPFQVLFVGLAVLNGTTLQILFWGGYPNFLAFVFFNEGLVFLLAFARTRSTRDGLLLYVIASLLFLTHDLTFVLFVATLLTTALFLLAQDRRWWRLLASRPNLYGILLLGGTVVTYTVATDVAGISHPGYLFANPAAFQIDNLGELFRLLGYAPLWFPIGPPVALDPLLTLGILLAAASGVFATSLAVRRFRPAWVPPRLTIGLAVVVATLLVPAGGYLLHVDTDYPRFVFFFALPLALVASLLAERVGLGWFVLEASSSTSVPASDTVSEQHSSVPSRRRRWSLSPRPREWAVHAGIFAVLALIFVGVILPTVALSEKAYATPTHDAAFVSAMNWLRSQNTTGAVLADSADTQRWVQALTDRNSVSAGQTWLHFYSNQVLLDEESFWAENTHYLISNNQAAISLSGYSTPWLNQSPMYSVFVDGVVFPVLRISTNSLAISGLNRTRLVLPRPVQRNHLEPHFSRLQRLGDSLAFRGVLDPILLDERDQHHGSRRGRDDCNQ